MRSGSWPVGCKVASRTNRAPVKTSIISSITNSCMKLRQKLALFRELPGVEQRAFVEAILMLGIARVLIISVPFRLVARCLSGTPETTFSSNQETLSRVRKAVTIAARNVPWNAVCLPQAIAAKAMLAWRGCGSSLHLGVGLDHQGRLIAHAWLVAGGTVVVGSAGISAVTPLARFG